MKRVGAVCRSRAMICATVSVIPISPTQGWNGPLGPEGSSCAKAAGETPISAAAAKIPNDPGPNRRRFFIALPSKRTHMDAGPLRAAGRELVEEALEVVGVQHRCGGRTVAVGVRIGRGEGVE